jgi:hypothetical protein
MWIESCTKRIDPENEDVDFTAMRIMIELYQKDPMILCYLYMEIVYRDWLERYAFQIEQKNKKAPVSRK